MCVCVCVFARVVGDCDRERLAARCPRGPYALQHLAGPRQDLTLAARLPPQFSADRQKSQQNAAKVCKTFHFKKKNRLKGPPTTLAKTHAARPNIIASEDGQILSEQIRQDFHVQPGREKLVRNDLLSAYAFYWRLLAAAVLVSSFCAHSGCFLDWRKKNKIYQYFLFYSETEKVCTWRGIKLLFLTFLLL